MTELLDQFQQKCDNEKEFIKVAKLLISFSLPDQQVFSSIMSKFKLNTNQTFEAVKIAGELRRANKMTEVESWLGIEPKSSQLANEFLLAIRAERYPIYSKMKLELAAYSKKINSKKVKVKYKDNFERNDLELVVTIKKGEDIEAAIKEIMAKSETIKDMLAFIKAEETSESS